MNVKTLAVVAFVGGCSTDDSGQIAVTQSNALGITMLETSHSHGGGADVLTVRALAAASEVATVRITVGTVPALADLVAGVGDQGSEIAIAIDGHQRQTLSSEREHITLNPRVYREDAIEKLFAIDALSAVLEREAHVFVDRPATTAETAYAWTIATCSSAVVLTSPTANQCCYWTNGVGTSSATRFFRPDHVLTERSKNPGGQGCRASDHTSLCNGQSCFYGPNAFARASLTTPTGTYDYMSKVIEYPYYDCYGVWLSSPPQHAFGDVVGSAGAACGCSCDGTGRICYDSSRAGDCPEANGLACNGGSPGTGCNPSGGSSGAADFAY